MRGNLLRSTWRLALIGALCLASACSSLPDRRGRPVSQAISAAGTRSPVCRAVEPFVQAHPGKSGLHALPNGPDALDARLALASMAGRSLDLQYYIWRSDESGKQLIAELLRAADRGVRVRILLDDLGTSASDDGLLALDAHPRIEVRLFNPIPTRSARLLGTVLHFPRANRRMHNKTFITDNTVAIVGGRNIGDEYFGAHGEVNFADLDLAAVGPVVRELSESFDLYWNSVSSIEITELTAKRPSPRRVAAFRAEAARLNPFHPAEDGFEARLRRGEVAFLPGTARAVYDHPGKIDLPEHDTSLHLAPRLRSTLEQTERELLVVSPYFVPGRPGVALLGDLRRRGVRVSVLTNSLASTDVAVVHIGYKRYRRPLLREGVELYEQKPEPLDTTNPRLRGASRASLHAKTFIFDRDTVFVGSMNVDPRSVLLNTEIGLLVDCPPLAAALARAIERGLEENAYRLELVRRRVAWVVSDDGQRSRNEPATTAWQRLKVSLLTWLPIEKQL